MLEKRWSFEGGTPVLREMPRTRSPIDLIEPQEVHPPDDTVRLDGGYPPSYAPPVRRSARFEPQADAEFEVRDAFAATALASLQSSDDDGSVLDVNGAELSRQVAVLPQPMVAEEVWTPPALSTPLPPPLAPDPVIQDFSPAAEPLPEIGRRQRAEARRNYGPAVIGMGVVGVLVLLAGGLYFTFTEREAAAPVAPERAVPPAAGEAAPDADAEAAADAGAEAAPAAASGEQLANVEGVLQLTDATLREVSNGHSGDPATSFASGQNVSLWLAFDYTSREAADDLGVIWFKGDQELTRSSFGLTSEVQMTAMAAPALEEPGSYRADISLNDEVIHSVSFEVTG